MCEDDAGDIDVVNPRFHGADACVMDDNDGIGTVLCDVGYDGVAVAVG